MNRRCSATNSANWRISVSEVCPVLRMARYSASLRRHTESLARNATKASLRRNAASAPISLAATLDAARQITIPIKENAFERLRTTASENAFPQPDHRSFAGLFQIKGLSRRIGRSAKSDCGADLGAVVVVSGATSPRVGAFSR